MKRLYSQDQRKHEPVRELFTREDWLAAVTQFPKEVQYHAANLAAHNWNVTLVGERLLITCPWSGGDWFAKDGMRVSITDAEYDAFYPRVPYDVSSPETLRAWNQATYGYGSGSARVKRQTALVLPNLPPDEPK